MASVNGGSRMSNFSPGIHHGQVDHTGIIGMAEDVPPPGGMEEFGSDPVHHHHPGAQSEVLDLSGRGRGPATAELHVDIITGNSSHVGKGQAGVRRSQPHPQPSQAMCEDSPLQVKALRTSRGQLNLTGTLTKAKYSKPKDKGPPKAGAFKPRYDYKPTQFRQFYERGDLPMCVDNNCRGPCIAWNAGVDVEKLDFHHYLPLFFDGLRERSEQHYTIAVHGARDMMRKGGIKVLPVVPQLIIPIKEALNTRDDAIVCRTLRCLQDLVCCYPGLHGRGSIGEALVPYYRQLLPVFNKLKSKNKNTGDRIDYGQQRNDNVGDLITDTLTMLESTGGDDAFINIKYMIPTYESCMHN